MKKILIKGNVFSNIIRAFDNGYSRYSNDKYVHRVKMEEYLKRNLKTDEFIHHIDENPSNNRIENLEILTNSEHRKLHAKNQNRDKNGRFACDQ